MFHHFFRRTGVFTPTAEESVNLRGHTFTTISLSLINTFTQTTRKCKAFVGCKSLRLTPNAIYRNTHNLIYIFVE